MKTSPSSYMCTHKQTHAPLKLTSGMVSGVNAEVKTGLWSFTSAMMMATDAMLTSLSRAVAPSDATRNA